jgi:sphingolipid delta-4 desaturase
MSDTEVDFNAHAVNAATRELRWHKRRRHEMLQAHPEIAALFGPTALTHALAVGALVVHVALAVACSRLPLVWTVLAAYGAGAWFSGVLGSAAHEYGHRLVRGPRWLAWFMSRLTTAMTALPFSSFFYHLHWGHHHSQGSQKTNEWGEFVDNEGWKRFTFLTLPATGRPSIARSAQRFVRSQWQILSSTFLTTAVTTGAALGAVAWRGLRREAIRPVLRDVAIDSALRLTTFACLFAVAGWHALVYVWCSDLFLRGLLAHPYLAWWASQHHMGGFFSPNEYVATGGVYGSVYNLLNTNGAKHCEHHDFPQVPWHRLPSITRIAPEFYRHVSPERTWSNVVWNYYWRTDLTFAYAHHPLYGEEARERVSGAGATRRAETAAPLPSAAPPELAAQAATVARAY